MISFNSSAEILGEKGPLADYLEDYSPRLQQQDLAGAIEKAIENKQVLIAEAGTGTGKTFAYLIPALLAKKKVIISTGTKNLQDQLFFRDLPFLRKVLAFPAKIALLKGRSNYVCQYKLENTEQSLKKLISLETVHDIEKIRLEVTHTKYGEISEIETIPENSEAWQYVTSTVDNCLGQECEYFKECYLMKARKKALEADLVVINHHLFFADLTLKQQELGELLPSAEVVILDEAHQLHDVASQFFGDKITSRQILELLRDTQVEAMVNAKDMEQISQIVEKLKVDIQRMRLSMGKTGERSPWQMIVKQVDLQQAREALAKNFLNLKTILEEAKYRSKGLENCWQRCCDLEQRFLRLTYETPVDQIHWYETFKHNFIIHFTPMSIADEFNDYMKKKQRAWIFTSATLAVATNFNHFVTQLGLKDADCLLLNSPFDYAKQAMLYVPRGLPDPNQANYTETMIQAILPILTLSQGRAFILFTSYAALTTAARLIAGNIDYPLLVQGKEPKSKLLETYRKLGNAVLLGTDSFWEGVDVRGEALSCVIIDKLPFLVPNDPIQKARALHLKKQGKNPFLDYQLPHAAISLKQGAGRLIRDRKDHGLLVICDPRFIGRDYGRLFLRCLPNELPRTRELSKVADFFKQLKEKNQSEISENHNEYISV